VSISVLDLSVVVPVYNETENIKPLIDEICAALRGKFAFEIVYVNDASVDSTFSMLRELQQHVPELRLVSHQQRCGQSTAIRNGVKAARAPWIATLDGDGQNNPADILKLIQERDRGTAHCKLYAGWRVERKDTLIKRISSRIANRFRAWRLQDATPDTGCGLKFFERETFLDLPYFDHMHRYLPALIKRAGFAVQSVPVSHRARIAGSSKYGLWDRLWFGITDVRGVSWLMRRSKLTGVDVFEAKSD
jgi:dolichol-phosphate mannosyltransferase